mmetsp:Transcript_28967/g.69816  ORF Transcript_28967/g.69816 Transcript_28967/m.69816 type:complete len:269 (-) Transcript_28967:11-817(-)
MVGAPLQLPRRDQILLPQIDAVQRYALVLGDLPQKFLYRQSEDSLIRPVHGRIRSLQRGEELAHQLLEGLVAVRRREAPLVLVVAFPSAGTRGGTPHHGVHPRQSAEVVGRERGESNVIVIVVRDVDVDPGGASGVIITREVRPARVVHQAVAFGIVPRRTVFRAVGGGVGPGGSAVVFGGLFLGVDRGEEEAGVGNAKGGEEEEEEEEGHRRVGCGDESEGGRCDHYYFGLMRRGLPWCGTGQGTKIELNCVCSEVRTAAFPSPRLA